MQGFVWIGYHGEMLGQNKILLTIKQVINPEAIFYLGAAIAPPAFDATKDVATMILICFGIMSVQFLYTYIEFFIVGTLCIMLLPFGVLGQTAHIAQNAIKAIVAIGVKVMVLVFITVIIYPIITQWKIQAEQLKLIDLASYAVASAAIAYLFWQAPSMAAGIVAGNSNLSGAELARRSFNQISDKVWVE